VKKEAAAFKLSLAQWSLNKEVREQGVSPFLFAQSAKDMGFDAVEYVSQLYTKEIEALGFDKVIDSLKILSESVGVENVLIMVDHEGDLADPDLEKRNLAVENHKKWVDAAEKLGAHSIRVNTFGTNDPELWKKLVDAIKMVNMANCGTLPFSYRLQKLSVLNVTILMMQGMKPLLILHV